MPVTLSPLADRACLRWVTFSFPTVPPCTTLHSHGFTAQSFVATSPGRVAKKKPAGTGQPDRMAQRPAGH